MSTSVAGSGEVLGPGPGGHGIKIRKSFNLTLSYGTHIWEYIDIKKLTGFNFPIAGITDFAGHFFHWILDTRSGGSYFNILKSDFCVLLRLPHPLKCFFFKFKFWSHGFMFFFKLAKYYFLIQSKICHYKWNALLDTQFSFK